MPQQEVSDEVYVAKIVGKVFLWIIGIVLILMIIFGFFYQIGAGERGILLQFGKPISDPIPSGLHTKIPIIQSVEKMNVQIQKYQATKESSASKDLQIVTTDLAVNYHILPDDVVKIYVSIGQNYQDVIIAPAIQEVMKAVTAKYTAEELITSRSAVTDEIERNLREKLKQSNIYVDYIAITNFDFSPEFNKAIEAKVVQLQASITAQNRLAQIQFEAQQRIAQANGEAEAQRIQIESIRQNGGEAYIQLQAINKWNGQLPLVTGSGAMPFLNLQTSQITTNPNVTK